MAPVQVLMLGYIANARKLTKTTNYDKLKAYTYIDLQFIREKLVKKKKKNPLQNTKIQYV